KPVWGACNLCSGNWADTVRRNGGEPWPICGTIIIWAAIVRWARICFIWCGTLRSGIWPFIWWVRRLGSARHVIVISAGSGRGPRRGLSRIGNHSRFLILPWVRVPHLASHLLGGLARRIAADWPAQHGWRLELLETFVETGRFKGVAYQAANWQPVGLTTGRTRQEKEHRPQAPRKSVWVYPLSQRFREGLGARGNGGGAP